MQIRPETTRAIFGIDGTAHAVTRWDGRGSAKNPDAIASQKWTARRAYDKGTLTVELRFDDSCKNGSQSFAITGEYRERGRLEACGCLHDDIAEAFPELCPLIQWHLTAQNGPMHYIANAVYLAGDRDCHGKRVGEPYGWQYALTFGDNPILHKLPAKFIAYLKEIGAPYDLEILELSHDREPDKFKPKWTLGAYGSAWYQGPFDTQLDATAFLQALQNCDPHFTRYATRYGEGKARELDAARAVAIWPDATDAELSVSKSELTRALTDRLPALVARFRDAMETNCGFIWQAGEQSNA